jgi:hypothetical protein
MRRLVGTLLGATLLSAPANATLQIALQVGPDAFFCADNTSCDTNPALGIVQVGNVVVDGIAVDGSIQASDHGPPFPSLNTSSLDIINTLATPIVATVAVSDTDFPSIAALFTAAGSGTWQGPSGSAITMGWFVDPANAQGADNAFDTPGVLLTTFSNASVGRTSAFSTNGSFIQTLAAPFSMTLQSTLTLSPGEALINRGQALVTSEVPETSTWAMIAIGFGFMAWGAATRKRMRDIVA